MNIGDRVVLLENLHNGVRQDDKLAPGQTGVVVNTAAGYFIVSLDSGFTSYDEDPLFGDEHWTFLPSEITPAG